MREPYFWRNIDPHSRAAAPLTRAILTPAAMLYSWGGKRRIEAAAKPFDPGIPVICVGNLTLGGAGKTPVTVKVRQRLAAMGLRAASLSRGYGGTESGPLRVDTSHHTAAQVGDEPLMLAHTGETWIARRRKDGARAMAMDGVDVIVMDDGHQNPDLQKALSIIVIDANDPFGNGFVFPKGPLREPVARGLRRADAVVLMGEGDTPPAVTQAELTTLRASLTPVASPEPGAYVAFAGIGRPQRFFDALAAMPGVTLAESISFADHHAYTASDIRYLEKLATERVARLMTTEKDCMRLDPDVRQRVSMLPVTAAFEDVGNLDLLLRPVITRDGGP